VRNTNIFYSFPQDYEDAESMTSKKADVTRETDYTEVEYAHPATPTTNGHLVNQSVYGPVTFDSYRIKSADISTDETDAELHVDLPKHTEYSTDTRQETINYFNGVERAPSNDDVTGSQRHMNGNKSVTFDPSSLYATVNKEGKTKF